MLKGVVTAKGYQNYVAPTTRELEQIELRFGELQRHRVTLNELTEQLKAGAIDHTDVAEDYDGMKFEPESKTGQVGVGDGI